MQSIALSVQHLTVSYDVKPVLLDVNFTIPTGTLSAIVGPNGAGKTTLLKAILGLIKPLSGEISFPCLNAQDRVKPIAYVPQSGSVDWDFPATVLDVVMMGRYGHLGWFRRPKTAERLLALDMLDKVGMQAYAKRQISKLSGGQQQRVFLARALAQQADIYLMDEPFKGVDAQTELAIVALLKELKQAGKTVIVVHHNLQTVPDYFDWVTLIHTTLVANGKVADAFTDEAIARTYRNRSIDEKVMS